MSFPRYTKTIFASCLMFIDLFWGIYGNMALTEVTPLSRIAQLTTYPIAIVGFIYCITQLITEYQANHRLTKRWLIPVFVLILPVMFLVVIPVFELMSIFLPR